MHWLDLGKVQEIEDMNIVSQMCAIAVMFVIMYFYISQKKIILHTSKAFVDNPNHYLHHRGMKAKACSSWRTPVS